MCHRSDPKTLLERSQVGIRVGDVTAGYKSLAADPAPGAGDPPKT